jgi:hypothetical protein
MGANMRLKALLCVPLIAVGLAGLAVLGDQKQSTGERMADAAEKFLGTLKDDQKGKATFAFDDKERTNWNFVPLQDKDRKATRKGLPIEQMTGEQKDAALALVKAGTSATGYTKATTIMSLEAILAELEAPKGAMVRNPGWYFFTVFGTPSKTGKWGWRVEGHHLSLNFTIDKGKVLAATPAFFGANPAEVKAGAKKGLRTLPEAEDFARELFASLDDEQRKVAFQTKQFPEIEQHVAKPGVGAPVGLVAEKMTGKQKEVLWKLVAGYAERMPPEVAAAQLTEVKTAGVDKIHFAFARDDAKPGMPYTYRVQGPTFVIEFLNVQADSANNPANHIHSAWRNLQGDFGLADK